jgi:hypothetical protein
MPGASGGQGFVPPRGRNVFQARLQARLPFPTGIFFMAPTKNHSEIIYKNDQTRFKCKILYGFGPPSVANQRICTRSTVLAAEKKTCAKPSRHNTLL